MDLPIQAPQEQADWLKLLLQHSHRRSYFTGTTIVHPGDRSDILYCIVKGSVSVVLEDDGGREIVLAYLYDGDFFGELGFFEEDAERSAWIVARKGCEVAEIQYNSFLRLAQGSPEILHAIATQISSKLQKTNAKVRDLAFLDVTGRIASALLELAQQPDAIAHPNGMQIRITRQEIARIVGCSREIVGRVLRDFEQRGLMHAHGKTMVIYV